MEDVRTEPKAAPTSDWILTLMAVILFVAMIALILVIILPSTRSELVVGLMEFPLAGLLVVILLLRTGRLKGLEFDKLKVKATLTEARVATAKAEKATKEVKECMKTTAASVLGLIKRSGRWGGYSYDEKEEIKEELLTNLREMEISAKEIQDIETKSKWHEYVAVDYVWHILGGQFLMPGFGAEAMELKRRPLSNIVTPDELEAFLKKYNVLTDEVRELVEDYRHYLKRHEQKRPEVWAKRGEWYKLFGLPVHGMTMEHRGNAD